MFFVLGDLNGVGSSQVQNFENQMIILDILGSAVLAASSKRINTLSFRNYLLNAKTELTFKNWWL